MLGIALAVGRSPYVMVAYWFVVGLMSVWAASVCLWDKLVAIAPQHVASDDEYEHRPSWTEHRTPNTTFRWIAVLGRWPGLLVAQLALHHKTSNSLFQDALRWMIFFHVVVVGLVAVI